MTKNEIEKLGPFVVCCPIFHCIFIYIRGSSSSKGAINMMEAPGTPTILGFSADEWHAIAYGLKDGFKFWKRTHIKYSEIDSLDESPEVKTSLKLKYHYYEIASDLPEDVLLLIFVLLYGSQNLPALLKLGAAYFGVPL